MGNALVCGIVQQVGKNLYRFIYGDEPVSSRPIEMKRDAQPKLSLDLFADVEDGKIVYNAPKKIFKIDMKKHLLMGLVKPDNETYFTDGGQTKLYYTGKTRSFPSTIALNKLYYFMPYIKGKGVRDLYLIRIARIGNKAEINPESNDTEPRLVFELEYLTSLEDYEKVKLNVAYTYRDTVAGSIWKEK